MHCATVDQMNRCVQTVVFSILLKLGVGFSRNVHRACVSAADGCHRRIGAQFWFVVRMFVDAITGFQIAIAHRGHQFLLYESTNVWIHVRPRASQSSPRDPKVWTAHPMPSFENH